MAGTITALGVPCAIIATCAATATFHVIADRPLGAAVGVTSARRGGAGVVGASAVAWSVTVAMGERGAFGGDVHLLRA